MKLDEIKKNYLGDYLRSQGVSYNEEDYFPCFLHQDSGRPNMKVMEGTKDGIPRVYCFACSNNHTEQPMSLIDCIMHFEHLDQKNAIRRAFELYGDGYISYHTPNSENDWQYKKPIQRSPKADYADLDLVYPDFTPELNRAHQYLMQNKPDFLDYQPMKGRVVTDPKSAWYYLADRGISEEMIRRYGIGYAFEGYNALVIRNQNHPSVQAKKNKQGKIKGPVMGRSIDTGYRLIRPYLNENREAIFFTAEIADRKNLGAKYFSGKYHKIRGLKAPIFNERYIRYQIPPEVIVVCEGYDDALSYEMAGVAAIGLIGVGHKRLLALIEKFRPKTKFILALDADAAGQGGNEALKAGLISLGVPFSMLSTAPYKDANEAWITNRQWFIQLVTEAVMNLTVPAPEQIILENESSFEEEQTIQDQAYEQKRKELWASYKKEHSARSALPNFFERMKKEFKPNPTGYQLLDQLLDGGFRPGLWGLGGMPGTGKSALATNFTRNMAKAGFLVIYVTIEMSEDELICRCIAAETALMSLEKYGDTRAAYSATELANGKADKFVAQEALERFMEYSDNIFFLDDLPDKSAEGIYEEVERVIKLLNPSVPKRDENGNRIFLDGSPQYRTGVEQVPFVVIDYMQILDPVKGFERATDKQMVDQSMKAASKLYLDYRVMALVLSSFNRANYRTEAGLESFKESGGLEAFLHGAMGLQTPRVKDFARQEEQNNWEALNGRPIDMELKIMKNRRGAKGKVFFKYYPKFDLFVDSEPSKGKMLKEDGSNEDDDWNNYDWNWEPEGEEIA